jgi:predicted hydrocarbon binding protein
MTENKKELSESELSKIGNAKEVVNQINALFCEQFTLVAFKDKAGFDKKMERILKAYGKARYGEGVEDGKEWRSFWKKTKTGWEKLNSRRMIK